MPVLSLRAEETTFNDLMILFHILLKVTQFIIIYG